MGLVLVAAVHFEDYRIPALALWPPIACKHHRASLSYCYRLICLMIRATPGKDTQYYGTTTTTHTRHHNTSKQQPAWQLSTNPSELRSARVIRKIAWWLSSLTSYDWLVNLRNSGNLVHRGRLEGGLKKSCNANVQRPRDCLANATPIIPYSAKDCHSFKKRDINHWPSLQM